MPGAPFIPNRALDIGFTPSGNIVSTNVQGAIEELDAEKASVAGSGLFTNDIKDVVVDYGADNTGASDSSTAFLNARDSGYIIYIPAGSYKISAAVVSTIAGSGFIGPQWADPAGRKTAIVYVNSTTSDGFRLEAADTFLAGFSIRIDPSRTPTAGAGITVGIIGGAETTRQGVHNMSCYGLYDCIRIGNVWGATVNNFQATLAKRFNFLSQQQIPYGACIFSNISTGSAGVANVKVTGGEYNRWTNIGAGGDIAGSIGVHLEASYDIIQYQNFQNIYSDNIEATGYAIKVEKPASYGVYNNTFDVFTGGYSLGRAAYVGVGCKGTTLSKGTVSRSTSAIAIEDNGTDTSIIDCKIRNESHSTTVYAGIKLGASSVGAKVRGNTSTQSKYGIEIASGATYAIVSDNDFRGNSTAAALVASGVKATSKFSNNQGLDDWETSVALAPEASGLYALVAGQWYRSKGISAPTDWVLLG